MISEPDTRYIKELHSIYKSIFVANIDYKKQVKLMTSVMAWEPWSWRVTGISKQARKTIIDTGSAKGCVRDHFVAGGRNGLYKSMFYKLSKPLPVSKFWKKFWVGDQCVILTSKEHNQLRSATPSNIYPLDWKQGFFACNDLVGFKCRKKTEIQMLKSIELEGSMIFSDFVSCANIARL